ncbi:polysaccharide deacetylase family protein [Egicoccus sp. AB-alg2]|uniref:polysaccharide deacetylase family protein n=1 Tax=Egicoccus sp. AB-alg2 TaxID=3242693 RepID=UPI00359D3B80
MLRRTAATVTLVVTLTAGWALPTPPAHAAVTPCSRGTVALTFDDGPHARSTPRVLDVLAGRRVKATFFQVGSMVAANPAVARRVHADGHVLANHTYRHENLTRLGNADIRRTIDRTNRAIVGIGAPKPTLVRPPYGATSTRVRDVISGMGMRQLLWDVDPQDWRSGRSAATIRDLVLRGLRDGAVVLLHDASANVDRSIAALPAIIDGARSRGYCLGTLDQAGRVVPPVPAARIDDVEVTEGAAGTKRSAVLTVRLSEPTSRAVSIDWTTVDGSAVAGEDYKAASGTLTIPRGATRGTIKVTVRGDDLDEPNERFTIRLRSPAGVTLARAKARVTILDDDPPAASTKADASAERDAGEGAADTAQTPDAPADADVPTGAPTEDGDAATGATAEEDVQEADDDSGAPTGPATEASDAGTGGDP